MAACFRKKLCVVDLVLVCDTVQTPPLGTASLNLKTRESISRGDCAAHLDCPPGVPACAHSWLRPSRVPLDPSRRDPLSLPALDRARSMRHPGRGETHAESRSRYKDARAPAPSH